MDVTCPYVKAGHPGEFVDLPHTYSSEVFKAVPGEAPPLTKYGVKCSRWCSPRHHFEHFES